jgi:hypothetical protein
LIAPSIFGEISLAAVNALTASDVCPVFHRHLPNRNHICASSGAAFVSG